MGQGVTQYVGVADSIDKLSKQGEVTITRDEYDRFIVNTVICDHNHVDAELWQALSGAKNCLDS